MDAQARHEFALLRQEIRSEALATREAFGRVDDHMTKRDVVLFGEDGRGGLVQEVAALRAKSEFLSWLVGVAAVAVPSLVAAIVWFAQRGAS